MTEAAKELASNSAIGAGFVLLLLMLFWVVKRLVDNSTRQTESMTKGMEELVAQSRAIRDNCLACRSDSLATLRTAEDEIKRAIWEAKDKATEETRRMLDTAVGSIQRDRLEDRVDELSRPHQMPTAPSGVVRR